jgi:DNA-binding LytR/AlgR family response regulator
MNTFVQGKTFVEYRCVRGGDRVLVAIDKINFVEVADMHIIIHMDNGESLEVHDSIESPWMVSVPPVAKRKSLAVA